MTYIKKLGVPELRTELKKIQLAHPKWRNPQNDNTGMCHYTAPDGCHCMIAQLAFEMGWSVPPENYEEAADAAASVFEWPVTDEGLKYLEAIQIVADGINCPPLFWCQVDLEVES